MINAYQYEPVILRVETVDGKRFWVSKRRYYQVGKTRIPTCRWDGLRHTYRDVDMPTLHRDNIAKILYERANKQ